MESLGIAVDDGTTDRAVPGLKRKNVINVTQDDGLCCVCVCVRAREFLRLLLRCTFYYPESHVPAHPASRVVYIIYNSTEYTTTTTRRAFANNYYDFQVSWANAQWSASCLRESPPILFVYIHIHIYILG